MPGSRSGWLPGLAVTLFCIFWLGLLSAERSAAADENHVAYSAALGYLVSDYRVQEFSGQSRLVSERGSLPGVSLDAAARWQGYELAIHGFQQADRIDHDGQTQSGTAFDSTTDTDRREFGLQLTGRSIPLGDFGLAPMVGIGQHRWDRDIQSSATVTGIEEIYRWRYYSAGLQLKHERKSRRVLLRTMARWADRVDEAVRVKNDLGSARLAPRADAGFIAELRWEQRYDRHWWIVASLDYQRWEFERSRTEALRRDGSFVATIFQPALEVSSTSFSLAAQYRF